MSESAVPKLRQRLRLEADAAILRAAERAVGGEGVGRVSMQAIAREAGVAVGTLYNHFGDRDGLLKALVVSHRHEFAETIEVAREHTRGRGFRAEAQAFVQAVFEMFDKRRPLVRAALDSELWRALACSGGGGTDGQRIDQQIRMRSRELVELGIREGTLLSHAPDTMTACLSGALRGVLMNRATVAEPLPAAKEAHLTVNLLLFGLANTGTEEDCEREHA